MKKQLFGLSILTALLSTSAFAAGPIANIQVTGDIKPPTCTVNGATQNDVVFDFSAISPSMVPQSSAYRYPSSVSNLTKDILIQCDAQTYLTFKTTDTYESADSSNIQYPPNSTGSRFFQLVPVNNPNLAIGGLIFVVKNSSVDDNTTVISRANDGTYTASGTGLNQVLIHQATMTWTATNENGAAPDNLTLIPGQNFRMSISNYFNVNFAPFVTSQDAFTASGIDISDGLDFMGEAVLTFNFGV